MNQPTNINRIQVSKYFHLDEFIDPHTYFNTPDNGLSKIDPKLFAIADLLRELKGTPGVINTWWKYYTGKRNTTAIGQIIFKIERSTNYRKWSGLRTSRCSVGAKNSAHRQGKAFDMVGLSGFMYDIVKENAEKFYNLGLRRMEDHRITPTWLHLDTLERNTEPNSIRVVDLTKATEIIRW